jgi:hypothetical protein
MGNATHGSPLIAGTVRAAASHPSTARGGRERYCWADVNGCRGNYHTAVASAGLGSKQWLQQAVGRAGELGYV